MESSTVHIALRSRFSRYKKNLEVRLYYLFTNYQPSECMLGNVFHLILNFYLKELVVLSTDKRYSFP